MVRTERSGRERRRHRLRLALHAAAVGLVVVFVYRERHVFQGFASTLGRVRWPWVVAAVAAELASIPPLAEANRVVLRIGGAKPPRWRVILVILASNAISMSAPAGVAIAEGYAYTKFRRFGARKAVAAWVELAVGAIAFSVLAAIGLAGAVVADGRAEAILVAAISVLFVGSAVVALLFRHPPKLVRVVGWMERHVGRRLGGLLERASKRARDMAQALKDVHPSIRAWALVAGLSLVNWLMDVVCLGLSFQAVRVPIPWGAVLLAFAGGKAISSLGITPGGLGLVEGGLVATFVAYGTKSSSAVAAVLVYRAITFVGLVGAGWAVAAVLAAETHRAREG